MTIECWSTFVPLMVILQIVLFEKVNVLLEEALTVNVSKDTLPRSSNFLAIPVSAHADHVPVLIVYVRPFTAYPDVMGI